MFIVCYVNVIVCERGLLSLNIASWTCSPSAWVGLQLPWAMGFHHIHDMFVCSTVESPSLLSFSSNGIISITLNYSKYRIFMVASFELECSIRLPDHADQMLSQPFRCPAVHTCIHSRLEKGQKTKKLAWNVLGFFGRDQKVRVPFLYLGDLLEG